MAEPHVITALVAKRAEIAGQIGAHFRNRWAQLRRKPDKAFVVAVPQAVQHLPLPHVLKVGEEWSGIIEQTPEIDQMAKNGLLYVAIYQSVKSRPVSVRIIISDS